MKPEKETVILYSMSVDNFKTLKCKFLLAHSREYKLDQSNLLPLVLLKNEQLKAFNPKRFR